jgi:hypothetical protein
MSLFQLGWIQAMNAFAQVFDIEIDELAGGISSQFEVRYQLSFVDRGQDFYGFQFDDDQILDNEASR